MTTPWIAGGIGATPAALDDALSINAILRLHPVAPHHNVSTVMLTVLAGEGILSGGSEERLCAAGDLIVYEPSETHGMRAVDRELLLLATITPCPGERTAAISPRGVV